MCAFLLLPNLSMLFTVEDLLSVYIVYSNIDLCHFIR